MVKEILKIYFHPGIIVTQLSIWKGNHVKITLIPTNFTETAIEIILNKYADQMLLINI